MMNRNPRPRRHTRKRHRQTLALESLERRAVLSASFDLVGITSLRSDPTFSQIDGQLPDGRKVGVAVIDTGVYASHPDLSSNFVAYYDAVTKTSWTTNAAATRDPEGHGTHVSGTAVSSNPDYGVATRGGLISVRALTADGERPPTYNPVVEALRWVSQVYQQYNIRVVNMSLGTLGSNLNSTVALNGSQDIAAAIHGLEQLGITVVTASGNYWADLQAQGSSFPGNVSTITVGNTWGSSFNSGTWGRDPLYFGGIEFGSVERQAQPDQLAAMSQRSATLPNQIMAPGMRIESTSRRGGSEVRDGTSMAAPLVTGVVALMQDAAQTFGGRWLAPAEVARILRDTADVIVDRSTDGNARFSLSAFSSSELLPVAETGQSYPRINAYRALQAVRNLLGGGSAPVSGQDLNGTMANAVVMPNLNGSRVFNAAGSIGRDGSNTVGSNDVDLFKLMLDSYGSLSIHVSQDPNGRAFDPYLRLFNSAGQQIAAVDDTVGRYPALQTVILPPGTYYAGISSYNNTAYGVSASTGRVGGQSEGEYLLSVTLDNPDPNGVIQGAMPVDQWASVPGGSTGYYWAHGEIGSDPAPVDGDPRVAVGFGDVDMYQIVAPDSGWLVVDVGATPAGLTAPNPLPFDAALNVFDENGTRLAWNDDVTSTTTDPSVRLWLNRGQKVYVGVSHAYNAGYSAVDPYNRPNVAGAGTYEIAHWFETGDVNGSAWAAVDQATVGSTIQGMVGWDYGNLVGLDGRKDVDFMSYAITQSGVLDVSVSGQAGFVPAVTLWKWDPQQQNVVRIADRSDSLVDHRVVVEPGEFYYVSVTGAGNSGYQWYAVGTGSGGMTGAYTVTSSLQPYESRWQSMDDTFQGAAIASLGIGNVAFGELGYDQTLYRGTTDVDLYRFQPQVSDRVTLSAFSDGAFGALPVLRFFDSTGAELAFSQSSADGRAGSSLQYDVAAGQTYYVGVSGWAQSGNLRAYQPTGSLSTVEASTGGYFLTTRSSNSAPSAIALSGASVLENQPAGTAVGTLATTDPDSGNTFTYSLVAGAGSSDNGSFTIVGNELRTTATFDYETKSTYAIRVRSTDQGGLFTEQQFTISVGNVDEPFVITAVEGPAARTYRPGEAISVTLVFNSAASVRGVPTLPLLIGRSARQARLTSGSGTNRLVFTYVAGRTDNVAAGQLSIGPRLTVSRTAAVLGPSGQPLSAILPVGVAGFGLAGVAIDGLAPRVSGAVTVPVAGTYRPGDVLEFVVRFSEQVFVKGVPQIGLAGFVGATRQAICVSGTGTNSLTFRYVVTAGDQLKRPGTLAISVRQITLPSGPAPSRITDAAGNAATSRELRVVVPSLRAIAIDGTPPGIT